LSEEWDTAERAEQALAAMSSSSPTADHIEALRAARMAAQHAGAQPIFSSEGSLNNARAEASIKLGAVQQAMATSDPQLPSKINAALAAVRDWKNCLPPR
jgi:hypothetical protein